MWIKNCVRTHPEKAHFCVRTQSSARGWFWPLFPPRHNGEHEDDVTEEFSDGRPENNTPNIGTQEAKGDGDGCAEDGEEGEGGNPGTFLLHVVTGFAQAAFLDMHPFGDLLDAPDATQEVIEHGTKHVSDGTTEDGKHRIHACGGEQGTHHYFRTERNEGASQERGQCHA